MFPSIRALQTVSEALAAAKITAALGGSGLLYSLGLVEQVRDWDLTTDASLEEVATALGNLTWAKAPCGDPPFASTFRLGIIIDRTTVDLMGSFAIIANGAVCRIPTIAAGTWNGVTLGSPEAWAAAYRLMGRDSRADVLHQFLLQRGADPAIKERLLAEPLPAAIRAEVEAWPE